MGIWPGHRGYTPTLYEKCHGIFNDHREYDEARLTSCAYAFKVRVRSFTA